MGATILLPPAPGQYLQVTIAHDTLQFSRDALANSEPQAQVRRYFSQPAPGRINDLALAARIAASPCAATASPQIAIPKTRLDLLATLVRYRRKEREATQALTDVAHGQSVLGLPIEKEIA